MFSCHIIIAQADYNKIDDSLGAPKRPRYEGTLSMEKKLSFNFMMIRKQNR
jgi:hypothetical protein